MQTANPKTAQTFTAATLPTTASTRTPSASTASPKPKHVYTPGIASTTEAPAWTQLSFVKIKRHRARYVCADWFAVPDQSYSEGNETGLKVMAELLAMACDPTQPQGAKERAMRMVLEAATLEEAKPTTQAPSKRGAAVAVLQTFGTMMVAASQQLNVQRWIRGEIARGQALRAQIATEEAEDRAAFTQRMKLARAAKRAQTLATAKGGQAHA